MFTGIKHYGGWIDMFSIGVLAQMTAYPDNTIFRYKYAW